MCRSRRRFEPLLGQLEQAACRAGSRIQCRYRAAAPGNTPPSLLTRCATRSSYANAVGSAELAESSVQAGCRGGAGRDPTASVIHGWVNRSAHRRGERCRPAGPRLPPDRPPHFWRYCRQPYGRALGRRSAAQRKRVSAGRGVRAAARRGCTAGFTDLVAQRSPSIRAGCRRAAAVRAVRYSPQAVCLPVGDGAVGGLGLVYAARTRHDCHAGHPATLLLLPLAALEHRGGGRGVRRRHYCSARPAMSARAS